MLTLAALRSTAHCDTDCVPPSIFLRGTESFWHIRTEGVLKDVLSSKVCEVLLEKTYMQLKLPPLRFVYIVVLILITFYAGGP